MSEKHETSGVPGEPVNPGDSDASNPFAIAPAEPAERSAPRLPPEDIDAGVEKLQAHPADLSEPPKTIVSDVLPSWPSWTDGNLPPVIIYGPTSFRRTPPSVPLEPAPAASSAASESAAAEQAGSAASLERTGSDAAGLDEIFDSIEHLAPPPAEAPPAPASQWTETPPPLPDPGPATMSGAWPPAPMTMPLQESTAGPATMSGQWPPAPLTQDLADSGPETRDGLLSVIDEPITPLAEPPVEVVESSSMGPATSVEEEPLPADALEHELPAAPTVPTPSTMAVSAVPFEVEELPVAAAAAAVGRSAPAAGVAHAYAGYAHDASHGQTAAQMFDHAHHDVEHRHGILSLGLLTRLAGVNGLLACFAGLAIMMLACAGMTQLSHDHIGTLRFGLMWGAVGVGGLGVLLSLGSILFKSWKSSAIFYAALAIVMGGGWFALGHFQMQIAGFDVLSVSRWLTYGGLGGLGLTIVAGFLEHRRLREETAVLASLFSNALASVGSGLLWWLSTGASLFGK